LGRSSAGEHRPTEPLPPEHYTPSHRSLATLHHRLGPSDLALATVYPFVTHQTLTDFFLGNVKLLDLREGSIGSHGLVNVMQGLSFAGKLEVLNIAHNRVGFMAQEGLLALAETVQVSRLEAHKLI
jgi:hypothetical protein